MRLIDADAFDEYTRIHCQDSLVDLWCELIRRQPTIDVAPVRHGKWIQIGERDNDEVTCRCNVCNRTDTFSKSIDVPYCWHCGAKMDAK